MGATAIANEHLEGLRGLPGQRQQQQMHRGLATLVPARAENGPRLQAVARRRRRGRRRGGHAAQRIGKATNPGPQMEEEAAPEEWQAPEAVLEEVDEDGGGQAWPVPLEEDVPAPGGAGNDTPLICPRPPPELEDAAMRSIASLRRELARLRRTGVPQGHTWSALLVPIVWLTLPVYAHRLLLPTMIGEGVAMGPLLRLMKFWRRQGVMIPADLVAWMRERVDSGGKGTVLPFGYLLARAQERITQMAGVPRQLGYALHGALRRPTLTEPGPRESGVERCMVCLGDLHCVQNRFDDLGDHAAALVCKVHVGDGTETKMAAHPLGGAGLAHAAVAAARERLP